MKVSRDTRRRHQLWCHWRLVAGVAVILATCAALFSQQTDGSVSGTVIDANTQAPVSGVSVEIPGIGQAMTDETGRFRILNVPSGRFSIQAVRSGMTPDMTDRSSWSITVSQGEEVRDVRLRMFRFGNFRGRVLDDQGKPLSGVLIQALLLKYQQGRRIFVEPSLATGLLSSSVETNENGEYQLELPTGVYYVSGSLPSSDVHDPSAAHVMGGRKKVYYPGTTDSASATPVMLSGQEASGFDFKFAESAQALHKIYVRVEGIASAARNFIPPGAKIAELRDRFSMESFPILGPENRGIGTATDGGVGIVIDGVPDGSYDLLMEGGMEGGIRGRGITPVDVRGEDLHNVVVSLQPAQDITGRVTAIDPTKTASYRGLTVQLGTRSANVESNGTFTFPAVLSGFYSVSVDGLPPDSYVADIRYGGISLHETAHDLNGPQLQAGLSGSPLQILVAYNGGSLEGVVDGLDGGRDIAVGATVVLVPDMSRRFVQSYYKATVIGNGGTFTMSAVPPGVYQLFAWQSIPATAWLNPEFMSRWEGRGQIVSIEAGRTATVKARLFTKED
jgi:hypothetical protein